jgi:hypothetical protein
MIPIDLQYQDEKNLRKQTSLTKKKVVPQERGHIIYQLRAVPNVLGSPQYTTWDDAFHKLVQLELRGAYKLHKRTRSSEVLGDDGRSIDGESSV